MTFIMAEGIDGSGKGTILTAAKEWAHDKGLSILDLKEYWDEYGKNPDDFNFDVILSCEPTRIGFGKAIREEIIAKGSSYNALSRAHAFSLDREIYYNEVILKIPKKSILIQERGVLSTMVYQPAEGQISMNDLMHMPGNKLAISHPPNFVFLCLTEPKEAIRRLNSREKKDNSTYENLPFLEKIDERYRSDWLKQIFPNSKFEELDSQPTIEEFKDLVKNRLNSL